MSTVLISIMGLSFYVALKSFKIPKQVQKIGLFAAGMLLTIVH